ncbi:MAG: hypothetical protein K8R48_09905 [Alphaproteobacteria bacterium]|nr:hypothetical protein [Alphaproteobacteria bacterium]
MRLGEKISKLRRGLQRLICGKSNEKTIVTGHTVALVGGMAVPVDITAVVSKTGVENQLEFEKSQAVLVGPARDVIRVRQLDAMIGKLMKPFNGAAKVPDKTVAKIEGHISDIADSLKRVGAYQPGISSNFSDFFSKPSDQKTLVWDLEYANTFRSPAGAVIEQTVAKFRLGK